MSTAEKIFPDLVNRWSWSKQDWKRWNLCGKWLAFEHGLLEQTLGREATLTEHREHALKVFAAIWDREAQHKAEWERRKAEREAKVVPLRPDNVPLRPDNGT